jgi:hypothetical protein
MRYLITGLIGVLLFPQLLWLLQDPVRPPVVRAKRPQFDPRDVDGVFFKNIFEEALVGERPADFGKTAPALATNSGTNTPNTTDAASTTSSRPWSTFISATTIQDEVKAIKINLDTTITTPNKFASGGAKEARVDFTILAMLFGVINDYDAEVKWKRDAAAARDAFAKCAANASTSDERAYQQAKTRRQDLADILSGGSVSLSPPEDPNNNWVKICDRTPLMLRLKKSFREVIKPGTASAAEFKARKDEIAHEANLIAAIGEILAAEGMEDSVEQDYVAYAKSMKQGAIDLIEAVKLENADMGGKAAGVIDQACSRCHEDWQ